MSNDFSKTSGAEPLLDRSDVRVKHATTLSGLAAQFLDRVKSGDIGSLPVIIGLVIILLVFGWLNPVFLSSNNLVNLLFDSSTVGIISLGIVCVLMVGEIDLSVGSMSGLASAILGTLWVNAHWPLGMAVVAAVAAGCVIGAIYALLYNWLGMPSFISTLAGLLALLGLQLYLLGSAGSINLPYGSWGVDFGQTLVLPAWLAYLLAVLPGVALFVLGAATAARRRAANLSAASLGSQIVGPIALTVFLELVVYYLNTDRGVPWMFALFVVLTVVLNYVLTRTKWGRAITAVGGNREAARRAGIPVKSVYLSVFMLCAMFAAFGGVLAALRLASSSQQAGTGDVNLNAIAAAVIGGTSLFGGRGSAYSALLGIIVIQSIASGLTMLDLSSSLRYMITGAVLAIAVIVDSLARQSRVTHGRA